LNDEVFQAVPGDAPEDPQFPNRPVRGNGGIEDLETRPVLQEGGEGFVLFHPPAHGEGVAGDDDLGMPEGRLAVPDAQAVDVIAIGEFPSAEGAGPGLEGVAQDWVMTGAFRLELDRGALPGVEVADHVADPPGAVFEDVRVADEKEQHPLQERQDDQEQDDIDDDQLGGFFQLCFPVKIP